MGNEYFQTTQKAKSTAKSVYKMVNTDNNVYLQTPHIKEIQDYLRRQDDL